MKCGACGYRYKEMDDENWDDGYKGVSDGSDKFEEINGHFTRTVGDYYSFETEVCLFACPRCETVKIKKW